MKKTILTIALFLAAWYGTIAQTGTCIEYKETGIIIRTNIIGRETNIIRYTVNCPIGWLDIAQDLLNITMTCKDGLCSYSSFVSVPNLPHLYSTQQIQPTDNGIFLDIAEQKWGANIILGYGLLGLDYNWTLKNK